ncbi:MAG: hypothetical protein WC052_06195 [Patescibacteria group bacterium]
MTKKKEKKEYSDATFMPGGICPKCFDEKIAREFGHVETNTIELNLLIAIMVIGIACLVTILYVAIKMMIA